MSSPQSDIDCSWVLIFCLFCLFTTAYSSTFCSALVTLNLVPGLIQLLPFSQGINIMVCISLGQGLKSQSASDILCLYQFVEHNTYLCYVQVLRVLANICHKKRELCLQLTHLGLLPAICATLKMADREVVSLGMDVLFMLLVSDTKVSQLKTMKLLRLIAPQSG